MTIHRSLLRRVLRVGALVTACSVVAPVSLLAQKPPLAEVARKEAERRKGAKQGPKVITTKDLPESARKGAPKPDSTHPTEGQAAGAPAGEQKGEKKPDAIAAAQKDEAYWHGRITQAREALRRNESFLAALQSQVNGLTTDFVNRDDPYQRAQIGEQRQKVLAEMERVKADIEGAKKQIADIEEEARKAGVPPGYLR
jgi:hypothetical protein